MKKLRSLEWLPYALIIYLLIIFCMRTFLVAGGTNDDGEQLFYSQSWALGYEVKNPPLYTWILILAQSILGPTLLSITSVKFILLGLIYFLFYNCAKKLNLDRNWVITTLIAPLGLYYLVWDAVRNYSHSILLIFACMLTLNFLLDLLKEKSNKNYILFGLAILIGTLSKVNYFIFLFALIAATFSIKHHRNIFTDIRFMASIPIILLITSPILIWTWHEWNALQTIVENKFALDSEIFLLKRWGLGLKEIGESLFMMIFPLSVFTLLSMPRIFTPIKADNRNLIPHDVFQYHNLLRNWFFILLAITTVIVLSSGATNVRTHIFFIFLPVVLLIIVRAQIHQISGVSRNVFISLCVTLALLVPVIMMYKLINDPHVEGRKPYLNIEYKILAESLQKKGFNNGTIIALDYPYKLSGNLRPYFQDSRILSLSHSRFGFLMNKAKTEQCLLVWFSFDTDNANNNFIRSHANMLGNESAQIKTGVIDVPLKYAENISFAFSYAFVTGSGKECG